MKVDISALRERAKAVGNDIPAVFIAVKDRETPTVAKLLGLLTICYALSPIDLVPDFIPVLGYLDDLILLPLLAAATIRRIPGPVLERARERSREMRETDIPNRWLYALPFIAVAVVAVALVVKAIL